MNKVYRLVKNRSTGVLQVVSELASGAKKGKTAKIAVISLAALLSTNAIAVTFPNNYAPNTAPNKKTTVTSTQTINLGAQAISPGSDPKPQKFTKEMIDTIVQEMYEAGDPNIKLTLNNITELPSADDQTRAVNVYKNNTYTDPVTERSFKITERTLTSVSAASEGAPQGIQGAEIEFYEKMKDQYNQNQMFEVTGGSGTTVTIEHSGTPSGNDNVDLTAISKNSSNAILVTGGANLVYEAKTNYYTGGDQSRSEINSNFTSAGDYHQQYTVTLTETSFKTSSVNTVLGPKTITTIEQFNQFSADLIQYIKDNTNNIAVQYSTEKEMQAFYDAQLQSVFDTTDPNKEVGGYTVEYTISKEKLQQVANANGLGTQFANRVTEADRATDIGLKSADQNFFIGVKSSGSTIKINGDAVINSSVGGKSSSGTVIKADWNNGANNIFQIDGTITGGSAIVAKNADITVSATGKVNGSTSLTGTVGQASSITNDGQMGSITANTNVTVTNQNGGKVNGSVSASNGSRVTNDATSVITGVVSVSSNSTVDNKGTVGGIYADNSKNNINTGSIKGISNGPVISLTNNSYLDNKNSKGILIGYSGWNAINPDEPLESNQFQVASGNAINVASGSKLEDGSQIHVSSKQQQMNVINVSGGGTYIQEKNGSLTINTNGTAISGVSALGNSNNAIYVHGDNSNAEIQGSITLKDSGSTALYAVDKGKITLGIAGDDSGSGIIDVASQKIAGEAIRSFGAWIEGTGTELVMQGSSKINLNADRAIGVHIRNGATAVISEDAGITFGDHENQIGFLISGISNPASINYTSRQDLILQGKGSVLFRVERGSVFNTQTIESGGKLSKLDSGGTEDSTLVVITNGATAAGVDNQTIADLSGFTLKVDGKNAKGVSVEGGANAKITSDTTIILAGEGSTLAKVDGHYYDLNGKYNPDTNASDVGHVGDDTTPLKTSTLSSAAQLIMGDTVTGTNSIGYHLTNGGKLVHGILDADGNVVDILDRDNNIIGKEAGRIEFTNGTGNIGVKIEKGGELVNVSGSTIEVIGTAIDISGAGSIARIENVERDDNLPVVFAKDGTAAYRVSDHAKLELTGAGITQARGSAHGVLVDGVRDDGGVYHAAESIVLNGAVLDLRGDVDAGDKGNGIENKAGIADIQLINDAVINVQDGIGIHSAVGLQGTSNKGTINVYGDGTGIKFEGIDKDDGSITGAVTESIKNEGYEDVVINVHGEDGQGIYINSDTGTYTGEDDLEHQNSNETKVSSSVNILHANGNSALIIKGNTDVLTQSGRLHSASTGKTIVEFEHPEHITEFTNNGDILFGGFTGDDPAQWTALTNDESKELYAIQLTDTDKNGITFTNNSKINGIVQLLGHTPDSDDPDEKTISNTVNLTAGSGGNRFITGDGNDVFNISKAKGKDAEDFYIDDNGDRIDVAFASIDGGDGDDLITFKEQSDYTITKDTTLQNVETVILKEGSKLTLDQISNSVGGLTTGTQTYDITDADSTLVYIQDRDNTTAFDSNRVVKGIGTLQIDSVSTRNVSDSESITVGEHDFAFDTSSDTTNFAGTLDLHNVNYDLVNGGLTPKNTSALTNAILKVSANSLANVGNGKQEISGLDFSDGTVNFDGIDLSGDDLSLASHHVDTQDGKLKLNSGNVMLTLTNIPNDSDVPETVTTNILTEDDVTRAIQLVIAKGGVEGNASNLTVVDKDGHRIESTITRKIAQGGNDEVARATYGVAVESQMWGEGDVRNGLYAGFGLTKLELKERNSRVDGTGNALIFDATGTTGDAAADFKAQITDYLNEDNTTYSYGDLQIKGEREISLKNVNNDYHGSTYVLSNGKLLSYDSNVLGNTRLLHLADSAEYNLNGKTQSIGSLITSTSSTVDLKGGKLTITGIDGTTSENVNLTSYVTENSLSGGGELIIDGTKTDTSVSSLASNGLYKPEVKITGENSALTANVTNANGIISVDNYKGLGSGALVNNGVYNLMFSTNQQTLSNSSIKGTGVINKYNAGTANFDLSNSKEFTGDININGGAIRFNGNAADAYTAKNININQNGALIGANNTIFEGKVTNTGRFYVGNENGKRPTQETDYKTVIINNDDGYVGKSGTLIFNGVLGGDDSWFNRLIINGNASGHSYVQVNNIGGAGAQTEKGILLIRITGDNNATFTKVGRIMAGAYDYKLLTGAEIDAKINATAGLTRDGEDAIRAKSIFAWSDKILRAEYGGYISNLAMANSMFNLRLHDRLGETQYTDVFTGKQEVTSMWMRNHYSYNTSRAGGETLEMKAHTNVTQIGGDIAQWTSNGLNRLHLGLMAGYGDSDSKSRSLLDSSSAESKLHGYSYGAYGTWYSNDQDKTGLYVDTWAMWNNLKASVKGEEFSESYRIKGLTASLESGYSFLATNLGHYNIWLQPKGQLIWSDMKADSFTEKASKARISTNDGNLQTRLGLRTSFLYNPIVEDETGESSNHQFFAELNWLHNSKAYQVTADDLDIKQDGVRNIGELKLGVEGNIRNNTNVWLNVATQKGNDEYKEYSAQVGVKYSF